MKIPGTYITATNTGSHLTTVTVPANTMYRFKSIYCLFECSADVGNRQVTLEVINSTGSTVYVSPLITAVASERHIYIAFPSAVLDTTLQMRSNTKTGTVGKCGYIPFPDMELLAGWKLQFRDLALISDTDVTLIGAIVEIYQY